MEARLAETVTQLVGEREARIKAEAKAEAMQAHIDTLTALLLRQPPHPPSPTV